MTKSQKRELLDTKIELFNLKYPAGTPGILLMDSGEKRPVKVRWGAREVGGYATAWFEGVSGCYLIDRFSVASPEPKSALEGAEE